jgi:hypothetical protein
MKTVGASALWLLVGSCSIACSGAGSERETGAPAETIPLPDRLAALDRDLSLGSTGSHVTAVQDYLYNYGYFPNAELATKYPTWRPKLAVTPDEWGLFDDITEEAVRQLQAQMALPVTGVVDESTRAVLRQPRCGHPDGAPADPSEKFALSFPQGGPFITYRLQNEKPGDVSFAQLRQELVSALNRWAAETSVTFSETTSVNSSFSVRFDPLDPGTHGLTSPFADRTIKLNVLDNWSVTPVTPGSEIDLQTVLLHEVGHALGLNHSAFGNAAMRPNYSGQHRTLAVDDKLGVSAYYDTWEQLPGCAKDIAANEGQPNAWAIGCDPRPGGFGIHQWNGSTWTFATGNGGAVRIAVDLAGFPWAVNDVGQIFRRTTTSATSGTWVHLPGGCAKDIAAASVIELVGVVDVWAIGCDAVPGGFSVRKFNGFTWDVVSGRGGRRIAVDTAGRPWIIEDSSNAIFRRELNGTWQQIPGDAFDIGAAFSFPNAAWKTGGTLALGGLQISALSEQGAVGSQPAVQKWETLPTGRALQVTVGSSGRPWVVNFSGQIFRTVK